MESQKIGNHVASVKRIQENPHLKTSFEEKSKDPILGDAPSVNAGADLKGDIYLNDEDVRQFISVLARVCISLFDRGNEGPQ